MRNIFDRFINFILINTAVIIIALTVYFCLDVFGVIQVPEKYSIAGLFYSKIEIIAAGESLTEQNIIDSNTTQKKPRIVVDQGESDSTAYIGRRDTVERLQALQEKYNEENPDSSKDVKIEVDNPDMLYYSQLDEYAKIIYDFDLRLHLTSHNNIRLGYKI